MGRVGETLVIGPVDRNSVLSLMNTNVFNSRQIGALNLYTYSKLPTSEFIGAYPIMRNTGLESALLIL